MTVNATGCGFNLYSKKWNIFFLIYISISLLWCRNKSRRWVTPLNKQCLQSSAKIEELSIWTLGSLCLPCYMRDTAWSWLDFLYMTKNTHLIICQLTRRKVENFCNMPLTVLSFAMKQLIIIYIMILCIHILIYSYVM